MKKQKVEKAKKEYLFFEETFCDPDYCYDPYGTWDCDPGCLDYEEKLLTNFRNKDKIKRKENNW